MSIGNVHREGVSFKDFVTFVKKSLIFLASWRNMTLTSQ